MSIRSIVLFCGYHWDMLYLPITSVCLSAHKMSQKAFKQSTSFLMGAFPLSQA